MNYEENDNEYNRNIKELEKKIRELNKTIEEYVIPYDSKTNDETDATSFGRKQLESYENSLNGLTEQLRQVEEEKRQNRKNQQNAKQKAAYDDAIRRKEAEAAKAEAAKAEPNTQQQQQFTETEIQLLVSKIEVLKNIISEIDNKINATDVDFVNAKVGNDIGNSFLESIETFLKSTPTDLQKNKNILIAHLAEVEQDLTESKLKSGGNKTRKKIKSIRKKRYKSKRTKKKKNESRRRKKSTT